MQTSGYDESQLFSWAAVTGSGLVTGLDGEPTSQPIPSLSVSNPCASSPITLKLEVGISPQSKSGG